MTIHNIEVAVCRLPHFAGLHLPQYESDLAAGVDLQAAIEASIRLAPGERELIPTGLSIALPSGYEAQIRPRSGLAIKYGLTCLNSPGTIDADYRGEIKVILANLGKEDFLIERGMRIAQLLVAPVYHLQWREVESLDETQRGTAGFGSTGVSG